MMSVGNLVLRRGFYSAGPNAVCGPRQTQSYNDFKIPSLDVSGDESPLKAKINNMPEIK